MTFRFGRTALAIAAVAALGACSGAKQSVGEAIGAVTVSPDPFNVVPRAPLRLPPSLSDLPEPQPGAPSPLEPQPILAARAALANAGEAPAGATAPSPGEQSLLAAAGVAQSDPDIRATLAQDDPQTERRSQYGLTSFLGFAVPDGTEEEILEPREEAARARDEGLVTPNPTPGPPPRKTNSIQLGG